MNPIRPSRLTSLRALCEVLAKTHVGRDPSALKGKQGPLACGHEQKENENKKDKCRGWGDGVVGDRRVGSVREISRETRRDQNGVHGREARRAARRESERS